MAILLGTKIENKIRFRLFEKGDLIATYPKDQSEKIQGLEFENCVNIMFNIDIDKIANEHVLYNETKRAWVKEGIILAINNLSFQPQQKSVEIIEIPAIENPSAGETNYMIPKKNSAGDILLKKMKK